MIGKATTMSLLGLGASEILVEATQLNGLPNFTIVGLPDTAVNEARVRLRAAFQNVGIAWPKRRLTVNLSPADVTKSGTGFDLALAMAILGAQGYQYPKQAAVLGELGLDGSVRPVRGVLPALVAAKEQGAERAIVPWANESEARLVQGLKVTAIHHLAQLAQACGYPGVSVPANQQELVDVAEEPKAEALDLIDVYGQEEVIAGIEIAAAGGHHLLMVGPAGVGKSMLARRMPGIMPGLGAREAMEVAAIASVAGQRLSELPRERPLAAPHHSASTAAMVGGGSGIPRPGAITTAHHGVLFCDEFAEFAPRVIQALRQPLEAGYIDIARARVQVRFPARFQLVAAANPCRCGKLFDGPGKCTCTSRERRIYQSSLGGPVRDRIDLYLAVRRPSKADLRRGGTVHSADVRDRVAQANERQIARLRGLGYSRNALVPGRWLRANTPLPSAIANDLETAINRGLLSMRGFDRVLRIGWTVADLAGRDKPNADDLAYAYALRGVEQ